MVLEMRSERSLSQGGIKRSTEYFESRVALLRRWYARRRSVCDLAGGGHLASPLESMDLTIFGASFSGLKSADVGVRA